MDFNKAFEIYKMNNPIREKEYGEAIKLLFYTLVSSSLTVETRKIDFFEIGLAIHPMIIIPSGGGKRVLIRAFKSFFDKSEYSDSFYLHSQHLLGKKTKKEEIDGEFKKRIVIIDEADYLYRDNREQQTLQFLRKVKDAYGEKRIEKISLTEKTIIDYQSSSTIITMIRPFDIKMQQFLDGDLRRDCLAYVHIDNDLTLKVLRRRSTTNLKKERMKVAEGTTELKDFLLGLREMNIVWKFDKVFCEELYRMTEKIWFSTNKKSGDWLGKFRSFANDIMNNLIKMSCIQSLLSNKIEKSNVNIFDLQAAYSDYKAIWKSQIDFCGAHVEGFDLTEKNKQQKIITEWMEKQCKKTGKYPSKGEILLFVAKSNDFPGYYSHNPNSKTDFLIKKWTRKKKIPWYGTKKKQHL